VTASLDPRDHVPCSCGQHQSLTRELWSIYGPELLTASGAHRSVLDCIPLAQLDPERATQCLRLAGVEAVR
jgi:hypothetical protein